MDPEEPRPASIFEQPFGGKIPGRAECHGRVGQTVLGVAVAIGHRRFGAFFDIEHEVDGKSGTVRPVGMWRGAGISDEGTSRFTLHATSWQTDTDAARYPSAVPVSSTA